MVSESFNPGWIEIIVGPMFAGKSEELIRRMKRMDYAKKKYVVFKPAIDYRYDPDCVVSHTQQKKKAISIKDSRGIMAHVSDDTYAVCIDEVQFFDLEIVKILNQLAKSGKRVIVSGLDTDFKGEPFPVTSALMASAENVTKLSAICVVCGAPGTMTQRLVGGAPARRGDPIVMIGADESYEPRCRQCHEIID